MYLSATMQGSNTKCTEILHSHQRFAIRHIPGIYERVLFRSTRSEGASTEAASLHPNALFLQNIRSSKTEIGTYFSPQAGFPSIDFEVFRVQPCDWHGRRRQVCFVGGIFGPHIKRAFATFAVCIQAVNRQTKKRQYVVVDDVIEKNGIRIEGIFRKDDALRK